MIRMVQAEAKDSQERGFSRAECRCFVEEPGFSRASENHQVRALAPEAGRLIPLMRSVNF
ncbi:MAG: hypothetical protein ACRD3B_07410 [Candidatus Sulfotelmatobacter sp.]